MYYPNYLVQLFITFSPLPTHSFPFFIKSVLFWLAFLHFCPILFNTLTYLWSQPHLYILTCVLVVGLCSLPPHLAIRRRLLCPSVAVNGVVEAVSWGNGVKGQTILQCSLRAPHAAPKKGGGHIGMGRGKGWEEMEQYKECTEEWKEDKKQWVVAYAYK